MTDIVTTLRERPYRLASESNTEMQGRRQAEREYAAHEIEVLRLEKAKLAADNERLRAALEQIVKPGGADDFWQCYDIALAALDYRKMEEGRIACVKLTIDVEEGEGL